MDSVLLDSLSLVKEHQQVFGLPVFLYQTLWPSACTIPCGECDLKGWTIINAYNQQHLSSRRIRLPKRTSLRLAPETVEAGCDESWELVLCAAVQHLGFIMVLYGYSCFLTSTILNIVRKGKETGAFSNPWNCQVATSVRCRCSIGILGLGNLRPWRRPKLWRLADTWRTDFTDFWSTASIFFVTILFTHFGGGCGGSSSSGSDKHPSQAVLCCFKLTKLSSEENRGTTWNLREHSDLHLRAT